MSEANKYKMPFDQLLTMHKISPQAAGFVLFMIENYYNHPKMVKEALNGREVWDFGAPAFLMDALIEQRNKGYREGLKNAGKLFKGAK